LDTPSPHRRKCAEQLSCRRSRSHCAPKVALVERQGQSGAMKSETKKLPQGHSYPLKPSVLATALERAGITIDAHLIRSPGNLFDAFFWPANSNVPYERLYVRAGSVSGERAADARRRVEEECVPHLVHWIAAILATDPKSPIRREEQMLNWARLK